MDVGTYERCGQRGERSGAKEGQRREGEREESRGAGGGNIGGARYCERQRSYVSVTSM